MKSRLGAKWTLGWEAIGFQKSLGTPKRLDELMALILRIGAWLKEQPELEHQSLGVTAHHAFELHGRFNKILNELDECKATERKLSLARKSSREALRKRIRGVVSEPGMLLAADDPLWLVFDLTPPSVVNQRRKQARAKTLEAKAASAIQETPSTLKLVESSPSDHTGSGMAAAA